MKGKAADPSNGAVRLSVRQWRSKWKDGGANLEMHVFQPSQMSANPDRGWLYHDLFAQRAQRGNDGRNGT